MVDDPQEEVPPPWVAIPGMTADNPATQGAEEAYIILNWLPFWTALSDERKADYLNRWNASTDWREAIAARYDWDPAEMARDAIEAEEWAAEHPLPPRRPWWRFWR